MNRYTTICLAACLFAAAMISSPRAEADQTVTVDPDVSWGVWQGWGCSLAWWANQFGARDDMADVVYTLKDVAFTSNTGTQVLPGLGLNVVRYNVGGTGEAPVVIDGKTVSPDNPPSLPAFKRIATYWKDPASSDPGSESWDWTADANQRAMMQAAKRRGADIFEMWSDSPPWWMCANDSTAGGLQGADNLPIGNSNEFAAYIATVARYAEDHWGITFESVEPFNEPDGSWWKYPGNQEGCRFSIAAQDAVLGDLRTALDRRGLSTMTIAASDDNTVDDALGTSAALSKSSIDAIGQWNTHGYQGVAGNRNGLYAAARAQGKRLWTSEYGEKDGSGMTMARCLNLDLRVLHPVVWCYWQPFDGGGWGLVQSRPAAGWVGTANPKYFVLAQYTRHIRPGMTMIDSGDADTVAAYSAGAHRLVLVTANYAAAQSVAYDLSKFAAVQGPITRWATNTRGGDQYVRHDDLTLSGKTFSAPFTPETVQTFEIQGVWR